MPKIVIVGHWCSLNKGEASIIKSMIQTLTEAIPDAEFVILSVYPELDSSRYGLQVMKDIKAFKSRRTVFRLPLFVMWALLYRVFKTKAHTMVCPNWRETLLQYAEADILLVNSGDILSTVYDVWGFRNILFSIFLAKLLKKTIVIYAQTAGPFKGTWSKPLARYIINMTNLVTVRDELSKKYLLKIGVSRPQVVITADPAFSLEPASSERGREILLEEGIDPSDRPLIGINISHTIYRHGFPELKILKEKRERYIEIMTKVIDYLTKDLNGTAVLVPHVFGPKRRHDDRVINQTVYKRIRDKRKVKLIENEYGPEELKRIIAQFDLFIGSRMHPLVHATSMNVPSIGIGYDHKTIALMKMLRQENYVCHIKSLSFNELKQKISNAHFAKTMIRQELKTGVEIMKKRARLNVTLVRALLKQKGIL